MNKLVIIGNGFDLGHNLPTQFKNFIESNEKYLQKYKIFKGEKMCIRDRPGRQCDGYRQGDDRPRHPSADDVFPADRGRSADGGTDGNRTEGGAR